MGNMVNRWRSEEEVYDDYDVNASIDRIIERRNKREYLEQEYKITRWSKHLRVAVYPDKEYKYTLEWLPYDNIDTIYVNDSSDSVVIRVNVSSILGDHRDLKKLELRNAVVLDEKIVFNDKLKEVSISNILLQNCTVSDIVNALPPTIEILALSNIRTLRTDVGRETIDISKLTNLRYLYINRVDVELSDKFDRLTSLNNMCIHNCKDISIPTSISKLVSLERLTIGHCDITDFPVDAIRNLPLRSIELYNNRLFGDILDRLCRISSLEHISLETNEISHPLPSPDTISNLSRLKTLTIEDNYFYGEINDEWMSKLPNIDRIRDNGCPYVTVSVSDKYTDKIASCIMKRRRK